MLQKFECNFKNRGTSLSAMRVGLYEPLPFLNCGRITARMILLLINLRIVSSPQPTAWANSLTDNHVPALGNPSQEPPSEFLLPFTGVAVNAAGLEEAAAVSTLSRERVKVGTNLTQLWINRDGAALVAK